MGGFDIVLWEPLQEARLTWQESKRTATPTRILPLRRASFSSQKVGEAPRASRFSDIEVALRGLQEDYFKTLTELGQLLDRIEGCRFKNPIAQWNLHLW